MNTSYRGRHLTGPVLLIGFGTLVLLINTGRLPTGLWSALLHLWPLALIVLGLDLLIPRRSALSSALVALLLLGVMFAGAAVALPMAAGGPSAVGGQAVSVPAAAEGQASLTFLPAAAEFRLDAADSAAGLITGSVRLPPGARLATSSQTIGNRAVIELKTVGNPTIPFVWVGSPGEQWRLHVSPAPGIAVTVNQGAGETVVDGRQLHLMSMDATIGAGRIEVWLPEEAARASLSAGVGELVVRVPRGASVVLRPTTVMGGTQVPAGYTKVGNEYRSLGYQAADQIVVEASVPVGGVLLVEY
jgi:hypothetical protein